MRRVVGSDTRLAPPLCLSGDILFLIRDIGQIAHDENTPTRLVCAGYFAGAEPARQGKEIKW